MSRTTPIEFSEATGVLVIHSIESGLGRSGMYEYDLFNGLAENIHYLFIGEIDDATFEDITQSLNLSNIKMVTTDSANTIRRLIEVETFQEGIYWKTSAFIGFDWFTQFAYYKNAIYEVAPKFRNSKINGKQMIPDHISLHEASTRDFVELVYTELVSLENVPNNLTMLELNGMENEFMHFLEIFSLPRNLNLERTSTGGCFDLSRIKSDLPEALIRTSMSGNEFLRGVHLKSLMFKLNRPAVIEVPIFKMCILIGEDFETDQFHGSTIDGPNGTRQIFFDMTHVRGPTRVEVYDRDPSTRVMATAEQQTEPHTSTLGYMNSILTHPTFRGRISYAQLTDGMLSDYEFKGRVISKHRFKRPSIMFKTSTLGVARLVTEDWIKWDSTTCDDFLYQLGSGFIFKGEYKIRNILEKSNSTILSVPCYIQKTSAKLSTTAFEENTKFYTLFYRSQQDNPFGSQYVSQILNVEKGTCAFKYEPSDPLIDLIDSATPRDVITWCYQFIAGALYVHSLTPDACTHLFIASIRIRNATRDVMINVPGYEISVNYIEDVGEDIECFVLNILTRKFGAEVSSIPTSGMSNIAYRACYILEEFARRYGVDRPIGTLQVDGTLEIYSHLFQNGIQPISVLGKDSWRSCLRLGEMMNRAPMMRTYVDVFYPKYEVSAWSDFARWHAEFLKKAKRIYSSISLNAIVEDTPDPARSKSIAFFPPAGSIISSLDEFANLKRFVDNASLMIEIFYKHVRVLCARLINNGMWFTEIPQMDDFFATQIDVYFYNFDIVKSTQSFGEKVESMFKNLWYSSEKRLKDSSVLDGFLESFDAIVSSLLESESENLKNDMVKREKQGSVDLLAEEEEEDVGGDDAQILDEEDDRVGNAEMEASGEEAEEDDVQSRASTVPKQESNLQKLRTFAEALLKAIVEIGPKVK